MSNNLTNNGKTEIRQCRANPAMGGVETKRETPQCIVDGTIVLPHRNVSPGRITGTRFSQKISKKGMELHGAIHVE